MFNWIAKRFASSQEPDQEAVNPDAPTPDNSAAEACKNRGNDHLAKGELDAASACYKQAISINPDYAEAYNNLGFVLFQQGSNDQAFHYFTQATQLNPRLANAHFNLGRLAEQNSDFDQAANFYRKSLTIRPDLAEAHNRLGILAANQGRQELAQSCFELAISFNQAFAEAHYNLGNLQMQGGRPEYALVPLQHAIQHAPKFFQAHFNLGNAYLEQDQLDQALVCYRAAIALNPNHSDSYHNIGVIHHKKDKIEEAIIALRKAVSLNENSAQFNNNLGLALYDTGRLDEAAACYRRAISLKPDYSDACSNLGFVLQKQGLLDEALVCLQQAISADPQYADAYNNLGIVFQDQGRLAEAITCWRKSLSIKPEDQSPQYNLAFAMLSCGQLVEGWEHYRYRFAVKGGTPRRDFAYSEWSGESLAGKAILIWGEQGVGDEILFASMFPEMIGRAGRCVIECTAKLVPLFARSFPTVQVVPRQDPPHPATREGFDYQSSAGGLARWLRPTVESFPHHDGYLVADPERVAYWRTRLAALGPGLKVGFCWRSGLKTGARHLHYTTLDQWGPIFAVPGVHFINVQYDDCVAELEEARQRFGISLHAFAEVDLFNDLAEAAALTKAMDLVITAPTAASSLAAAQGVPTWEMGYGTTWVALGTDHLPWLPAVRLYLRRWDQDWTIIIATIAERLAAQVR